MRRTPSAADGTNLKPAKPDGRNNLAGSLRSVLSCRCRRTQRALADEFIAYQHQHRDRRDSIIQDAAIDEIEIGIPVFEETLGPTARTRQSGA